MGNASVQIDHAGRIVLPKRLRERFGLRGGDTLAIEAKGDAIELRPATKRGMRLERVNGVLVLTMDVPLQPRDFTSEAREERIEAMSHETKETS